MSTPSVFISYSRRDDRWKKLLISQLRVIQKQGLLDVWDDSRIRAGRPWEQEIQRALSAASVAVLLISPDFLGSDFILEEEVRRILERQEQEGLHVLPVLVRPCPWNKVKWLKRLQLRPDGAKPLSGLDEHEVENALARIAEEIADLLEAPTASEEELRDQIAGALSKAHIAYRTEVAINGTRPDFVVQTRDGRLLVIEAKSWSAEPGFTVRAERQARSFEQDLGADRAFIVVSDLKRNRPEAGVVNVAGLVDALKQEIGGGHASPAGKRKRLVRKDKTVFASMPFGPDYDEVFFVAMVPAAQKIAAVCQRIDRKGFAGDALAESRRLIAASTAVVLDLSGGNPNVMYDAAFAHARDKPCVHLCATPLRDFPFDVSSWDVIVYEPGRLVPLREQLISRLRRAIRGAVST